MKYTLRFCTIVCWIITFLFVAQQPATAQTKTTGSVKGSVKDPKTKEAVIGGTVRLEGTTLGAQTDVDGNFEINNVPAGAYTVVISSVGFKTATLQKVAVVVGRPTVLAATLESDNKQLDEVVVRGVRRTNTEISVISEIRQANVVVSGISSEQIVKTQDRDAAEVVRRIPGVTIVDNRFIQIRGLSDRYNTVWLNDVTAPSSETDRKSFSFDVVPSSLIDRVLVFKDPSPELPGDFAGGLVKVYLRKPALNERLLTVNYSAGFRDGTTGKDFFTDKMKSGDPFGFGASQRDLPANFPVLGSGLSQYERDYYATALPNSFGLFKLKAMPDVRFNISYLDQLPFKSVTIGSITALNYTNSFTRYQVERTASDGDGNATGRSLDDQSTQNIRLGAIQNFNLVLENGGKLEFRNLFNQQSRNQVASRRGYDAFGNNLTSSYALGYQGRTTYAGQLAGTHVFNKEKTHFDWVTGYGYSARNEPDLRRLSYAITTGPDGKPLQTVQTPATGQVDVNLGGRLYQKLQEHSYTINANGRHLVMVGDREVEIGLGTYLEYRKRDFRARVFGYTLNTLGNQALKNLDVGSIFERTNINPNGFRFDEDINSTYRYDASNELEAGYLSFNIPFTPELKLVTGARYERNVQRIATGINGKPLEFNIATNFLLPSANLSYSFNEKNTLRAAYGRSLNRPEFREAAPFFFYDFELNTLNYGALYFDPPVILKVATIDNFDFRYEFYPSAGELIHIGGFYKSFTNPIENVVVSNNGNLSYTFRNAPSAFAYGLEVDVKKSLNFVSESLKNFSVVANASLIRSEITLAPDANAWNSKRNMQGQSPYVVNGGLYFNTPDNAWQVTALYNVFGPRIIFAGSTDYPDVVELPRHTVDLSLTKSVGQRLSINAGVQDLFNQRVNLVQDYNRDEKYEASDPSLASYRRGAYYTLGLRFTLAPGQPATTPLP